MNPLSQHYVPVEFMHANLKRPVFVIAGTASMFHYHEPTKSNVIYTTGGIIPVMESLEVIQAKFMSLNGPSGQGGKNVTTTEQPGATIPAGDIGVSEESKTRPGRKGKGQASTDVRNG